MRGLYVFSLVTVIGCNVVLGNEPGQSLDDVSKGEERGNSACTKGFADCNGDPQDGCETHLSEPSHCGACNAQCGAASALCVSIEDSHFACASGCPAEAPALCGYQCVNLQSSAANCAVCGHACPVPPDHGEAVCRGGACQVQCATGYHACGARCVGGSDPTACGDACTACPVGIHGDAVCDKGTCGVTCSAGFANCDGDPHNGCETALLEDAKHCGACDRPCINARCVGGLCLPLGGATDPSKQ